MSVAEAQQLLDASVEMGGRRVATRDGIAFVAAVTNSGAKPPVWHGYPEAWDNIEIDIKRQWIAEGKISRRDLRRYATRRDIRDEFGGSL